MGLITGLLTLPLLPMRGLVLLAEQIQSQAENEYYDSDNIRRQLEEVDELRQTGALTEQDATQLEEDLLARLLIGQSRADVSER